MEVERRQGPGFCRRHSRPVAQQATTAPTMPTAQPAECASAGAPAPSAEALARSRAPLHQCMEQCLEGPITETRRADELLRGAQRPAAPPMATRAAAAAMHSLCPTAHRQHAEELASWMYQRILRRSRQVLPDHPRWDLLYVAWLMEHMGIVQVCAADYHEGRRLVRELGLTARAARVAPFRHRPDGTCLAIPGSRGPGSHTRDAPLYA
jgi:hypothetical protein